MAPVLEVRPGAELGPPPSQPNNQAYRAEWQDTSRSRTGADQVRNGMAGHERRPVRREPPRGRGRLGRDPQRLLLLLGAQGWYEQAAAMASAYNDWQIEHWLDQEPRLRGSVHVVAHDPSRRRARSTVSAGHPQIVQVFLPVVTDRQYGDPMYHPIYEAAVRNDLVARPPFRHEDARPCSAGCATSSSGIRSPRRLLRSRRSSA